MDSLYDLFQYGTILENSKFIYQKIHKWKQDYDKYEEETQDADNVIVILLTFLSTSSK